MKFLVPNYSCLQNPRLWGYCLQISVPSVFCPQLNLLNPPTPEQNSWVRHCLYCTVQCHTPTNNKLNICHGSTALIALKWKTEFVRK